MDPGSQIFENLRFPHFLRDVLFVAGGTLILVMLFVFFPDALINHGVNLKLGTIFLLNLNFFAYFFIFSLTYLIGRLGDTITDLVYDTFKFIFNILFFCNKPNRTYYQQFTDQVRIFFSGGVKVNPFQKLTKENPNFVQSICYIDKIRRISDELERAILLDIMYSHFFIMAFISSFISLWLGVIAMLLIFLKKYQLQQKQNNLMRDIKKVIIFEQGAEIREEINKELVSISATQKAGL